MDPYWWPQYNGALPKSDPLPYCSLPQGLRDEKKKKVFLRGLSGEIFKIWSGWVRNSPYYWFRIQARCAASKMIFLDDFGGGFFLFFALRYSIFWGGEGISSLDQKDDSTAVLRVVGSVVQSSFPARNGKMILHSSCYGIQFRNQRIIFIVRTRSASRFSLTHAR